MWVCVCTLYVCLYHNVCTWRGRLEVTTYGGSRLHGRSCCAASLNSTVAAGPPLPYAAALSQQAASHHMHAWGAGQQKDNSTALQCVVRMRCRMGRGRLQLFSSRSGTPGASTNSMERRHGGLNSFTKELLHRSLDYAVGRSSQGTHTTVQSYMLPQQPWHHVRHGGSRPPCKNRLAGLGFLLHAELMCMHAYCIYIYISMLAPCLQCMCMIAYAHGTVLAVHMLDCMLHAVLCCACA